MDQADMADRDILEFLDQAINAARGLTGRDVPTGSNGIHCCDCGIEIPRARREAVAVCKYCIDCAELNEIMQKGSGRPISHTIQLADMDDNISNYDV